MVSRGEYLHFRCAEHAVTAGAVEEGRIPMYRCGIKGCNRPAKAYWYRGEQFANLPAAMIEQIDYDNFLP